MAVEIEAKMRLLDRPALEARLAETAAERVAVLSETNSYFDTADGGLKASDQGLRIRVETGAGGARSSSITHKGPRSHGRLKSRAETELPVDDPRLASDLLAALGYQHVVTFEKQRVRYALHDCRVELDTLPLIGVFVEIEGPSDDAVLAVRRELGLDGAPLIKASYVSLLISHLRERRVRETVIRLDPGPESAAPPDAKPSDADRSAAAETPAA
ncbi:MAG: class IV adenylate cyclase [Planctomycetota bacterium]